MLWIKNCKSRFTLIGGLIYPCTKKQLTIILSNTQWKKIAEAVNQQGTDILKLAHINGK